MTVKHCCNGKRSKYSSCHDCKKDAIPCDMKKEILLDANILIFAGQEGEFVGTSIKLIKSHMIESKIHTTHIILGEWQKEFLHEYIPNDMERVMSFYSDLGIHIRSFDILEAKFTDSKFMNIFNIVRENSREGRDQIITTIAIYYDVLLVTNDSVIIKDAKIINEKLESFPNIKNKQANLKVKHIKRFPSE